MGATASAFVWLNRIDFQDKVATSGVPSLSFSPRLFLIPLSLIRLIRFPWCSSLDFPTFINGKETIAGAIDETSIGPLVRVAALLSPAPLTLYERGEETATRTPRVVVNTTTYAIRDHYNKKNQEHTECYVTHTLQWNVLITIDGGKPRQGAKVLPPCIIKRT